MSDDGQSIEAVFAVEAVSVNVRKSSPLTSFCMVGSGNRLSRAAKDRLRGALRPVEDLFL
jgi:hypothetical protein